MITEIDHLREKARTEIDAAPDLGSLEEARVRLLGRSGAITALSERMREVPKEEKASVGKALNALRADVTSQLEGRIAELRGLAERAALAGIDLTLPAVPLTRGGLHPLTHLIDRAVRIFRRMGFAIADGPDIETEWHCFDALNTPADHPARNDQDTFYLPDGRLLRAHTSTIQIRTMESVPPPVRIIAPGAAYRRDEVDATHLAQFTQMEGLYVAEGVSLADLKGTIEFFFRELFGEGTKVRFRPHFFPFTEPSFEIDILSRELGGDWMELAGCGMVDPRVFEQVNERRGDTAYDPELVSGFAFGFGLDRLAMNLCGVPDIRMLTENDVRFLKTFA